MKVYTVVGKDNSIIAKELKIIIRKLRIGEKIEIKRVG